MDLITIRPDLMQTTLLQEHMCTIREAVRPSGGAIPRFDVLLVQAVVKAFQLRSERAASAQCDPESGENIVRSAARMYADAGWERDVLWHALWVVMQHDDTDGLRLILSLLVRGGNECAARKRFVFVVLVHRAGQFLKRGTTAGCDPDAGSEGRTVEAAVSHLREVAVSYLDELKEKAFASTFLEPTKAHFRAIGDSVMEGDVDVHGANTYAAVLLAALGVRLPRVPLLGDEAKGIVDFEAASGFPDFWKDENFGRAYTDPKLRLKRRPNTAVAPKNVFIFPGDTPRQVANVAVAPNSSPHQQKQLAKYLEQFAHYFSKEFILGKLFMHLYQEGCGADLDIVVNEVASQQVPCTEWLYNENGDMDTERGLQLFGYLQIAR
eukprot:TRINITY_DN12624_c0_g1_i2.p1 TRINITY_DN12624_c0_g1~~TRINITY_DN12624_c0_g1_i2.p1  ORF type:complete len:380 (-),score=72.56 TRINITY_DN12624_c0_g1_i2:57-1196(-)